MQLKLNKPAATDSKHRHNLIYGRLTDLRLNLPNNTLIMSIITVINFSRKKYENNASSACINGETIVSKMFIKYHLIKANKTDIDEAVKIVPLSSTWREATTLLNN